ncbi:Radical SAM domain protein (modular protein) [Candidatus Terasakiella magnetica]|nr:Radical SAM domain protein (modular protein) [Candidatus Terasakiella magnetica]
MSMSLADALAMVDREMAHGRFTQANAMLRQLEAQIPNHFDIARRIGYCTARLGDLSQASQHLDALARAGDQASGILLDMVRQALSLPAAAQQVQLDIESLRHTYFMDYPKTVTIETFSKCNANCVFCPYSTLARKDTLMPDALFHKIIGDLKQIPAHVPFSIAPFKVNEPFLDKRIFDFCHGINAQLPNAHIQIFSNGSTLTETNLRKLAEVKSVQHLWISLNHHEKTAYEALMSLRYDQTLARLKGVHEAVSQGWLTIPVMVSRVTDGSADDAAFERFVAETFPGFQIMMVGREDWVGQVDIEKQKSSKPHGCTRWYELSIMSTGEVALCCMDGQGKHVIGDVNHQSALEIYNSPGYRALRETVRTRQAAAEPCHTCTL